MCINGIGDIEIQRDARLCRPTKIEDAHPRALEYEEDKQEDT